MPTGISSSQTEATLGHRVRGRRKWRRHAIATIKGSATGLGAPSAIRFDSRGRLWAANNQLNTLAAFAPGATGNVAPIATIAGPSTQLNGPADLDFDAAGDLLVANSNSILEFAPAASGNVAPVRIIAGVATGLDGADGLIAAFSPNISTLPSPGISQTTATLAATVMPDGTPTSYYFQYGTTTSYGRTTSTVNAGAGPGPQNVFASIMHLAAGTKYHYRIVATSAQGTIHGSDRTLTTSALNSTPMVYVANTPGFVFSNLDGGTAGILGFAAGSRGNVAPAVTISGPLTGLSTPFGVAVDADGHVFTTDQGSNKVLEFGSGAVGNVSPIAQISVATPNGDAIGLIAAGATGRLLVSVPEASEVLEYTRDVAGQWGLLHTISGPATGLHFPAGVAFGPGGSILVSDAFPGAAIEFPPDADGNVAPTRAISGPATGLSNPIGLAADASGTTWVVDQGGQGVSVFAAGANGNATPSRTIAGQASLLSHPDSIALDGAGQALVADLAGQIDAYAATAAGDQAPFASIAGTLTGVSSPFGIAISPPLLGVATATLPAATTGTAYAQTISASGGSHPVPLVAGLRPPSRWAGARSEHGNDHRHTLDGGRLQLHSQGDRR